MLLGSGRERGKRGKESILAEIEITFSTSTVTVWNRVIRLRNKYFRKTSPIITISDILTDPKTKADAIADKYELTLNNPQPKDVDPVHMLLLLILALCDDSPLMYNSDLTLYELTDSLPKLKNTSHGDDKVHNKHLANLQLDDQKWVLEIFNVSFSTGNIP